MNLKQKKKNNDRKLWLYLSKIETDKGCKIIVNHIVKHANTSNDQVSVKRCIPKIGNPTNNSFMVGVHPNLKYVVNQNTFWPSGVAYEWFNFARGRNF